MLVGAVVRSALADQSRSGGPAVANATGMWHDATCVIRPGFRDAAAASYKAETRAVDLRNEVHCFTYIYTYTYTYICMRNSIFLGIQHLYSFMNSSRFV